MSLKKFAKENTKENTKVITARIPKSKYNVFKSYCDSLGLTVSEALNHLIDNELDDNTNTECIQPEVESIQPVYKVEPEIIKDDKYYEDRGINWDRLYAKKQNEKPLTDLEQEAYDYAWPPMTTTEDCYIPPVPPLFQNTPEEPRGEWDLSKPWAREMKAMEDLHK